MARTSKNDSWHYGAQNRGVEVSPKCSEVKSNKDRTLTYHVSLLGCIDDGQHFYLRKGKGIVSARMICYGKTITDYKI
jgi:hypothetical protein